MKIESKSSALWMVVAAMCLGGSGAAQHRGTPGGGGGGNLANDIREQAPFPGVAGWDAKRIDGMPHRAGGQVGSLANDLVDTFNGPIFDGGSVFVDLHPQSGLVLTVEPIADQPVRARPGAHAKRQVRLAGGTPGDAGAIVVSLRQPSKAGTLAHGPAISNTFGEDGSFVVELPAELDQAEVFVQGFEATFLGTAQSGILRVSPGADDFDLSWEQSGIAEAARRAERFAEDERTRLRMVGAAQMATLTRDVDVTVVIEKHKGGYSLYLGRELAQKMALVENESAGFELHLMGVRELAQTLESLAVLDAFADVENDLALAESRVAAQHLTRCGTPSMASGPSAKRAAKPTQTFGRSVDLGGAVQDAGVQPSFGSGTPIDERPHGARPDRNVDQPRSGKFDGEVLDAGSVTVDLTPDPIMTVAGWVAKKINEQPKRAGGPEPKAPNSGKFDGPVANGGSVTVDLNEAARQSHARRELDALGSAARLVKLLKKKLLSASF